MTNDFTDEIGTGSNIKYRVGTTAVIKLTLKDGTFHEDVGYGMAENKSKGIAFENAKKEAVSDARKRALRLFGNALGNSVYDRGYTSSEMKNIVSKKPSPIMSYEGIRRKSNGDSNSNTQDSTTNTNLTPSNNNSTNNVYNQPQIKSPPVTTTPYQQNSTISIANKNHSTVTTSSHQNGSTTNSSTLPNKTPQSTNTTPQSSTSTTPHPSTTATPITSQQSTTSQSPKKEVPQVEYLIDNAFDDAFFEYEEDEMFDNLKSESKKREPYEDSDTYAQQNLKPRKITSP